MTPNNAKSILLRGKKTKCGGSFWLLAFGFWLLVKKYTVIKMGCTKGDIYDLAHLAPQFFPKSTSE
jgi:hypothetical protein